MRNGVRIILTKDEVTMKRYCCSVKILFVYASERRINALSLTWNKKIASEKAMRELNRQYNKIPIKITSLNNTNKPLNRRIEGRIPAISPS